MIQKLNKKAKPLPLIQGGQIKVKIVWYQEEKLFILKMKVEEVKNTQRLLPVLLQAREEFHTPLKRTLLGVRCKNRISKGACN